MLKICNETACQNILSFKVITSNCPLFQTRYWLCCRQHHPSTFKANSWQSCCRAQKTNTNSPERAAPTQWGFVNCNGVTTIPELGDILLLKKTFSSHTNIFSFLLCTFFLWLLLFWKIHSEKKYQLQSWSRRPKNLSPAIMKRVL